MTTTTTADHEWINTAELSQRSGCSPYTMADWHRLASFPANARRRLGAGPAEWNWTLIEPWCAGRNTGRRLSNYTLLQRAKAEAVANRQKKSA